MLVKFGIRKEVDYDSHPPEGRRSHRSCRYRSGRRTPSRFSKPQEISVLLDTSGGVYTCGNGINGDLGHSDIVHENLDHFRRVEHFQSSKISKGEGPIVKIFCRADNVLAMTRNGHLYGWGGNAQGELGHMDYKMKRLPKKNSVWTGFLCDAGLPRDERAGAGRGDGEPPHAGAGRRQRGVRDGREHAPPAGREQQLPRVDAQAALPGVEARTSRCRCSPLGPHRRRGARLPRPRGPDLRRRQLELLPGPQGRVVRVGRRLPPRGAGGREERGVLPAHALLHPLPARHRGLPVGPAARAGPGHRARPLRAARAGRIRLDRGRQRQGTARHRRRRVRVGQRGGAQS